jgi:hypothetical protein
MARKPKTTSATADDNETEDAAESGRVGRRGGPRLTATERAEIVAALTRGESGRLLAERYGVSLGAIYSYRRKIGMASMAEAPSRQESELRGRLVSFAVRTLLGQPMDDAERSELETKVREQLLKRLAEGL